MAIDFDPQRQKAFDFVQNATNQVIALSTAILTLTITFADKFERGGGGWDMALSFSWVLYLVAIITGVWALLALTGTLEQTTTSVPVSIRESHITTPSFIQFGAFLLATILVVIYAIFAPDQDTTTTDTSRLVTEMKNQTAQLSAIVQKIEASDQSIKNSSSGIATELKELHIKYMDQLNSINRHMKDENELRSSHYKDIIDSINEVKKSIDKAPGEVKKILNTRKR